METMIRFRKETIGENGELHCSNCKNFLSVGPILYNTVFGNICGRAECVQLASADGVNSGQVIYESVAQFLLFPCRYQNDGCKVELKWGEVEQHEEVCEYKISACPWMCGWTGECSQILGHAEICHYDYEFKNPQVIEDLSVCTPEVFFINCLGNMVLVRFCNINNDLLCEIYAAQSIRKCLTYRIKFIDKTALNAISTVTTEVEILRPKLLESYVNNNKINLNSMENLIENLYCFDINLRFNKAEVKIKRNTSVVTKGILSSCKKELRENTCYYCCLFNTKICIACRDTNGLRIEEKYPSTAFDKLILSLDRPCENSFRGCNYVSSYFPMSTHKLTCQYARKKCIICTDHVVDQLAHFFKKHRIISQNVKYSLDMSIINLTTKVSYVVFTYGQFFILTFSRLSNGGLFYRVVCTGMTAARYTYQLNLTESVAPFSGMTFENICHPAEICFENYNISKTLSIDTQLPEIFLRNFFSFLGSLSFKINISEIKPSELGISTTE